MSTVTLPTVHWSETDAIPEHAVREVLVVVSALDPECAAECRAALEHGYAVGDCETPGLVLDDLDVCAGNYLPAGNSLRWSPRLQCLVLAADD